MFVGSDSNQPVPHPEYKLWLADLDLSLRQAYRAAVQTLTWDLQGSLPRTQRISGQPTRRSH
jgi:hypothetical protein